MAGGAQLALVARANLALQLESRGLFDLEDVGHVVVQLLHRDEHLLAAAHDEVPALIETALVLVLSVLRVAGGRADPRFFRFPNGTAGVLLENTGDLFRLTEVGNQGSD